MASLPSQKELCHQASLLHPFKASTNHLAVNSNTNQSLQKYWLQRCLSSTCAVLAVLTFFERQSNQETGNAVLVPPWHIHLRKGSSCLNSGLWEAVLNFSGHHLTGFCAGRWCELLHSSLARFSLSYLEFIGKQMVKGKDTGSKSISYVTMNTSWK